MQHQIKIHSTALISTTPAKLSDVWCKDQVSRCLAITDPEKLIHCGMCLPHTAASVCAHHSVVFCNVS